MEKTGLLSMELVDYVFSKFCEEGLVKEDILNMMEQFGLIVKFATSPTEVQYYVPAQLNRTPPTLRKMNPSSSDPCPLYLQFSGGFVPHGFFLQLVSRCTQWCSVRGLRQPPIFLHGASTFFIEKEFKHQLILLCKKRFIKIVLKQTKPEDEASRSEIAEVASLVRMFLVETLQNMSCELPWLRNLMYEICVACPYCPEEEKPCQEHGQVSCVLEDCMCLLKVEPGGQLNFCPHSLCGETRTIPGLAMWFSINGEIDVPKCLYDFVW